MKLFKCQHCGQLLYFENDLCVKCSHRLGFIPEIMNLSALEPAANAEPGTWRALAVDNKVYRSCANAEFGVCNWMIDEESGDAYCAACRHNRTVPDTSIPANVVAWHKIELAKHMLFYTLTKLRLPLDEKDESSTLRLRFDFLASPPHSHAPRVMTGHDNGLITLAIEEANDAEREKRRTMMHEPYRTLVGHFRHEVGHYYWDVLVRDGGHIETCRDIFGDETADYEESLKTYYADGAPPGWQDNFISAYATSHPWEDFAETWAHYLHIVDALEMARAFGMYVNPRLAEPGELDAQVTFDPYLVREPSPLIETWVPLSNALNSLNRTMGLPDIYPFILSPPVIEKLSAIHDLIHGNTLPASTVAGAKGSEAVAGRSRSASDKSAA